MRYPVVLASIAVVLTGVSAPILTSAQALGAAGLEAARPAQTPLSEYLVGAWHNSSGSQEELHYEFAAGESPRRSSHRCRGRCCDVIQRRTFASSTSSGTAPLPSSMSWNARMSKREPSSRSASARNSRIFSWPIL